MASGRVRMLHATGRRAPVALRALLGALLLALPLAGVAGPGACTAWAGEEAAAAERLAQARRLLEAGRADEAEAALDALLREAAPGEPLRGMADEVRRELARARLAQGRAYAALEPLEALARGGRAPDLVLYVEALLAHVREVLAGEGALGTQVAPFLEDARRALSRIPGGEAQALGAGWLAGELAYLAGDLAAAVERWDAAQAIAAGPRWALERRAHALWALGQHARAAAAYEELGERRGAAAAWSAAREAGRALPLYGALLAEQPDDDALLEEALSAARYLGEQAALEAVLAGLSSEDAARRAAWALARSRLRAGAGDRQGALQLLAAARASAPPAWRARLCAQEASLLLADPAVDEAGRERAAQVLVEGLAADPADDTLAGLVSYEVQRDFRVAPDAWPDRRPLERALHLQRAGAQARPQDPLGWANLGNVARLAGRLDEAAASFERALELGGGDAATRNDMALALLALGRRDAAEAALRAALAEDPGLLSARQNLARHLSLLGAAGAREAREQLLEAERRARLDGAPALVFRSLALKAWRTQRRLDGPGR